MLIAMGKKAIVQGVVKATKTERVKDGLRKMGLIQYPGGKRQRVVGCYKAKRCPPGTKAVRTASIKGGIGCKARHRSCQSTVLYQKPQVSATTSPKLSPIRTVSPGQSVQKNARPMTKRAYIKGRELWNKGDRSSKAIPPGTPSGAAASELYNYLVGGTPNVSRVLFGDEEKELQDMRRIERLDYFGRRK